MTSLLRAVLLSGALAAAAGADPLRVAVISTPAETAVAAALESALAGGGMVCVSPSAPAEASLILRGPGAAAAEGIRRLIEGGRPVVVIGADPAAWGGSAGFIAERLGADRGAIFAGGTALRTINLFPHPVLTGTEQLQIDEAVPTWTKLADDAQPIMEGITGEETTPLAWVRTTGPGRICHLVPSAPALVATPAYRRIIAQALLWTARRTIPGAKPVVQRNFLPESHPGAFAITFPEGVGVCLDPVRGGVNFAWEGDFVDLRPRWLTKQGAPARIFGPVFYTEKTRQPLRAGAPGANSSWRFLGYALRDGAPEFRYAVADRQVAETLRALPDGSGFTRSFTVAAGQEPLWLSLEEQSNADLIVEGAARDGNTVAFTSSHSGGFKITVRRRSAVIAP